MKNISVINGTARAISFLTRIPVPDHFFKGAANEAIARNAGLFPLAGALIGLAGGIVLALAHIIGLPTGLSAAIAIITLIVLTGALHEDGLGDVADGFGGGRTADKRLAIMKDSSLGTYGVIATVSSVLLRISALAAIFQASGLVAAACALIAAHASSRGAMVWFWHEMPLAREDGVSAKAGTPNESAFSLAAILALIILILFGIAASGFLSASVALGLGLCMLLGFKRLCMSMIGGQTGDTLGACQQLVEIAVLIGLASQFGAPT